MMQISICFKIWSDQGDFLRPGKESSDHLAKAPPKGHKRQQPLMLGRKVLQKDGGVEHEVSAAAKCAQADEQAKDDPVG